MTIEIIKISSAIILGFIALGLVVFLLYLVWWIISGFIEGVKQGIEELYLENNVSSWKEFIEKKRKKSTTK